MNLLDKPVITINLNSMSCITSHMSLSRSVSSACWRECNRWLAEHNPESMTWPVAILGLQGITGYMQEGTDHNTLSLRIQ
jgi:hypothetical protein